MADGVPDRVFLGWDEPLLDLVRDWLLQQEPSVLAETLVVVPTSNSGRRLRSELAAQGGGVLAPHVVLPGRLYVVEGVASNTQQLWAWARAIQSIDVSDFSTLFPNHAPGSLKNFRVAMALARQMMGLREKLAEADKGFRDALDVSPEKDRWRELCQLETRMLDVLKAWKIRDEIHAQRERSRAPQLPVGVTRVVVAGVPDLNELALNALRSYHRQEVPVSVLIHAPEKEAFDSWGKVDEASWHEKLIAFPQWEKALHVSESANEASELAVNLFRENQTPSEGAALALCDASFGLATKRAFARAGWPLYNPDGDPALDSGIARLLKCCSELFKDVCPFDAVRELVRVPGAEMFLPSGTGRSWAAKLMDQLHHEHLPETLEQARFLASESEKQILDSVMDRLSEARLGDLIRVVRSWLVSWLGDLNEDVAAQVEPVFAEVIYAAELMQRDGEQVPAQELMEMLWTSLSSVSLVAEHGESVLDLEGWLEVAYDPAAHLVLMGMHEGCVPDGSVDDAYLPEQLRQQLGVRSVASRYARDAFLLTSAIQCRAERGRVDAIVARFNEAGEACKPSRLLMRYEGEQLAHVVNHLFAESKSLEATGGAWTRDWVLDFPQVENAYLADPPRSLSPSAIKDYMDCPLRFFLKRVVKMDSFDADKQEMDALDFGNLCHSVLELFGKDVSVRDSVDAEEIVDYLSDTLDQEMERIYGQKINLPLMVQLESARERLRAFTDKQVAEREDGWRIIETEFRVGGENGVPWTFAGHPISMIVDRIDFHEGSKRWRVWDYKTTGKAKSAEEQHLKIWKAEENRPLLGELFQPAARSRSERRWAEVQLPLYAAFVQEHFQTEALPEVGYINLPRAMSDVDFSIWSQFDESMLEHALTWAKAAVAGIITENYQQATVYSTVERDWDEFAELAPDGLAAAFGLNEG